MKPTTGQLGPRDPEPHGITEKMRDLARQLSYRSPQPRETRPRDRSFTGKARIRARRAAARANQ